MQAVSKAQQPTSAGSLMGIRAVLSILTSRLTAEQRAVGAVSQHLPQWPLLAGLLRGVSLGRQGI